MLNISTMEENFVGPRGNESFRIRVAVKCAAVDTYVLFIRTTLYTEDVNRPRYVSSRDSRIIQAKALLA